MFSVQRLIIQFVLLTLKTLINLLLSRQNPQALIRESVGIGSISRINNGIDINKVLFFATIFFQQYIY